MTEVPENQTPETPQEATPVAEEKHPMSQTEAAESEKKKGRSETVTLSRSTLNTIVVGVVFLVVGVIIGALALGSNGMDETAVRRIVQEMLRDSGMDAGEDMQLMADDDPYIGDEDAPIVIVEFSAYACPYCGRHFEQTLEPLLENYGQYIRYVYRDFPTINPNVSFPAAMAANCAEEQGLFWEYHEILFENQELLSTAYLPEAAAQLGMNVNEFNECLSSQRYYTEVENDFYDASVLGISGTPSFYINGKFYSGAQPYEFFERVIQRELDAAGIAY